MNTTPYLKPTAANNPPPQRVAPDLVMDSAGYLREPYEPEDDRYDQRTADVMIFASGFLAGVLATVLLASLGVFRA